jgi:hypothetical protein
MCRSQPELSFTVDLLFGSNILGPQKMENTLKYKKKV